MLTGQEVFTLKGSTNSLRICFSPDGQRLVSEWADGTVKIWDAQTGQEALTLKRHPRDVSSICFSPDGHRLASASYDGTIKIWDATPIRP